MKIFNYIKDSFLWYLFTKVIILLAVIPIVVILVRFIVKYAIFMSFIIEKYIF